MSLDSKGEKELEEFVLKNAKENDPIDVVNKIDEFCEKNWMMNLGYEKGNIIRTVVLEKVKPKNILEIGGYCGYSAIYFAAYAPNSKVFTLEISKDYANIARRI